MTIGSRRMVLVRGTEGRHRVGRDDTGRWWFIDPDGAPWFHRGVTSVGLPGISEECTPEQQAAGAPERLAAPADVIDWLRGVGINALGAWTNPIYFDRGMPFSVLVHTRRIAPECTIQEHGTKMIDVFDPRFHAAYERACAEMVAPHAGSRDLIGYFTDNEPGWGQTYREHVWGGTANVPAGKVAPTLLQVCMAQAPDRPAHAAAWAFAAERAGGAAAIAARWDAGFSDAGSLRRMHEQGAVLQSTAYLADHEAFSFDYARRYFRIVGEALRRHDPNHLVLGCRYGGNPGPVILRAQREAFDAGHCDVLSMNSYRVNLGDRIGAYHDLTGMPVLNGEFAWASDYFAWPRADGSDDSMPVEGRVRARGIGALESGIAHPACVGYTWFKFRHRFTNADRPHYGLVNHANVANRFNVPLLRELNARADMLATGAEQPRRLEVAAIRPPGEPPVRA